MKDDLLPLILAAMHFLSFKEKIILQNKLDNSRDLALLSIDDISMLIGRRVMSRSWNGNEFLRMAEQAKSILESFEIQMLHFEDSKYPALVREIFDPPFMLFYRGNIQVVEAPCVSVVGTRKPSMKSAQAAFDFSKSAGENGCTVVSGMAFGIDSSAHKGAISGNGKSVAVLPCGADAVYPVANRRLAVSLLERGGCLLSEYLPGTPPAKFRFPQRNRIISALSAVTLVVEAPPKSGALITADFALEQGRDVYLHQVSLEVPKERCGVLSYQQDGAPVIASYEDYLCCKNAIPGTPYCKTDKQLYFS
ncbi:MAG: DNA-processing protein DprA [Spirochaetaceae bacterium]|nr:DNA-processing protein DprA [Spirochaetaceae bacterium]